MTRTRGAANQCLYRARILLDSWESARAAGRFPEDQLTGAFLPAVRAHLRAAYGWFLLATAGVDEAVSDRLPSSTADLAPPEAGRSHPPELREFALLEARGWLGELLDDPVTGTIASAAAGLLGSDRAPPGHAVARRWADELTATMQRMDDFRAEC